MARYHQNHGKNEYTCDQCDFKATQSGLVKEHIDTVHKGNQYSCNQCDYKASQKDHLTRHNQLQHNSSLVNQPTIEDFLRKVRRDIENEKVEHTQSTQDNENEISTQEMISDARYRRQNIENELNCEECSFTSRSETLLIRHTNREHKPNKTSSNKTYTSKRINCNHCTKKFNKNATFQKHMEQSHKEIYDKTEASSISEKASQNDLPNKLNKQNEVQSRVTRQRTTKTV